MIEKLFKSTKAAAPELVAFPAGAVICAEGELGEVAYLIESGAVEVSIERRGRRIVLGSRDAGEVVGEMALIDGGPRSATLTAREPTVVRALEPSQIEELLSRADPMMRPILRAVVTRFRSTLARLEEGDAIIRAQARELERALEQERSLGEMRRNFVSMASHEMRTPLAIIDGALRRLRRGGCGDRPDAARHLDTIDRSTRRMLALMESVLGAARSDAGALTVDPTPCDVAAILRACCARQAEISPSHEIAVSIDAAETAVVADPLALDQVFTNLLSNAVKYSAGADRVDVRLTREDDVVSVAVEDYGCGVDADDLPRIGEQFFRARASTGVPGTGLGLHLSAELLARHGGRLDIRSELGAGSVFTARVPVEPVVATG